MYIFYVPTPILINDKFQIFYVFILSRISSRLCDMPVPGSVFQPSSPDPTGRGITQGECGRENWERGGEAETAAGTTEGERDAMDDASANGERGNGGRGGQVGWRQGDDNTNQGR